MAKLTAKVFKHMKVTLENSEKSSDTRQNNQAQARILHFNIKNISLAKMYIKITEITFLSVFFSTIFKRQTT